MMPAGGHGYCDLLSNSGNRFGRPVACVSFLKLGVAGLALLILTLSAQGTVFEHQNLTFLSFFFFKYFFKCMFTSGMYRQIYTVI